MKAIINIIKFILITILVICLISIGVITIVSSTILNKEYITNKLEETNFYEETYELVKSNFENYIYQSGLDEEVLENICTKEKVKNDIDVIISNIYLGKEEKIDTSEISQKLNENIDKLNVKNSKNQKAIEEFVTHICNEYTETILHTKYEQKINEMYEKVVQDLNKIYNIVTILFIIDIIFLIVVNIKTISKFLQNIGTALLSSSIFNIIACQIIVKKVNIEGIKIFNDTFSKTIVAIIKEIIEKIVSLGVGELIIAIVFIVIYGVILCLKNNKNKGEEQTTDK